MATQTRGRANPTKLNLWIDIGLFAAIMLALAPKLTGQAIHEWLSVGLAAVVVVHLLRHWQWIVAVVKRFFSRLAGQSRLNFVLNIAFFINLIVVTFTGLMISKSILPLIGLTAQHGGVWESLHRLSADVIVYIAGLHVALHWKWILNALQRYIANPIVIAARRLIAKPRPVAVVTAHQEVRS